MESPSASSSQETDLATGLQKNWLDLTGFAMRVPFESGGGSMDAQWTFHAVIFVEGIPYNWSHLQMNFVPIQRPGMLSLDSGRFRCEGLQ